MFHPAYLLLAAAAAGLLPGAAARSVEVGDAVNRTVCAIEVGYDEDDDRIPQKIKTIKCAQPADRACGLADVRAMHCCHHEKMECVEMIDSVLVFNKKQNAAEKIEVSVGCACMIRGAHRARDAQEPHGR